MTIVKQFGTNIAEQSSTIGTASYELDGALVGYADFDSQFDLNDTPYYAVKNAGETKFEYNKGAIFTPGSPDTLARNVWYSSNANAAVSWDADDLPLIVYIPTSGELMEAHARQWLATARNAMLKFGLWFKQDAIATDRHLLNMYDGSTDIPVGAVNAVTHKAWLGTKYTRVQSGTVRQYAAANFPADNTIPQITEGVAFPDYDLSVTIESATSSIIVRAAVQMQSDNGASHVTLGAFRTGTTDALVVRMQTPGAANWDAVTYIEAEITNPGAGTYTFSLRGGASAAGSLTLNGLSANTAAWGGKCISFFEVQERFQ